MCFDLLGQLTRGIKALRLRNWIKFGVRRIAEKLKGVVRAATPIISHTRHTWLSNSFLASLLSLLLSAGVFYVRRTRILLAATIKWWDVWAERWDRVEKNSYIQFHGAVCVLSLLKLNLAAARGTKTREEAARTTAARNYQRWNLLFVCIDKGINALPDINLYLKGSAEMEEGGFKRSPAKMNDTPICWLLSSQTNPLESLAFWRKKCLNETPLAI